MTDGRAAGQTGQTGRFSGERENFAEEVKRSSRQPEVLRTGLERALGARHPDGRDFIVSALAGTSATGMSSETLLFEAGWTGPAGRREERLVARVAPSSQDVPVFPSYDLAGQFATIQKVAELTDVPVPEPWWYEADPHYVGAPFFVMSRVDGDVPPDVPPYNFGDSWLFHATPAQQRRLQDTSVAVVAELHAISHPEDRFAHLVGDWPGDTALGRHFAKTEHWYRFAAADAGRSDLIDRAFAWLQERWPRHESPAVFCWGDSRIGNVMYRDFSPVAVFDWEMAAIAPPETDLVWMTYLHQMFEDMATTYGFPHMPDFLRPEDVAGTYEKLTGHAARDIEWYTVYSALQLAIVYLRTGHRSVHFNEREAPSATDDLIMNAEPLARLIGG